jgi:hypothetical protein
MRLANPDTTRRAFPRRIDTGPSEYRERFRPQEKKKRKLLFVNKN